jgi:hypothetical protein
MGDACSTPGEMRTAYTILIRKSEGKKSLGRSRRKWKKSIELGHERTEFEDVGWIHLAQNRVQWLAFMNTAINRLVP